MIHPTYYLTDVIDADLEEDELYRAQRVTGVSQQQGELTLDVELQRQRIGDETDQQFESGEETIAGTLRLRMYKGLGVRLQLALDERDFDDDSPMLDLHPSVEMSNTDVEVTKSRISIHDLEDENLALRIDRDPLALTARLGQNAQAETQTHAMFANAWNALPFFVVRRADGTTACGLALTIESDEHFCGTGERFDRIDLFGRRIDLVNEDARGVNNDRAYKNVPLLLSSRPYGLFVHSHAKMRFDVGALSKRSLQVVVADDHVDVFLLGGGGFDRILYNYCRLTGFPTVPPTWSFGAWMSRMTYRSDEEVTQIAQRLRAERFPMDVIHLDTGWFPEDWKCEWRFSEENFPDPEGFLQRMEDDHFRVTLWQYPYVGRDTGLWEEAYEKGYIAPENPDRSIPKRDTIDFTNPDAVRWYKEELIKPLLEMGADGIKADFGENIDEEADYQGMDGEMLRNLYALIYQKAVFEVTEEVTGEPIIWARSSWAGSQRYPVHWGGDSESSFDGLQGTVRGGLHFGLSGFTFWSHDVGGFYGILDFRNQPSDLVYLRWTQVGVLSSHIRFHGASPREPWEYPTVTAAVREWLKFRYMLLPYVLAQSERCAQKGTPLFRALVFDWRDDPVVWTVSDEYTFGDSFLVCPVTNEDGVRDVYLPEGRWVDFWTGETIVGPIQLRDVEMPPERLPLYVREGAEVSFAEPTPHTDAFTDAERFTVRFDGQYRGFAESPLSRYLNL